MSGYDPFSYGEVKLGDKSDPAAESPDDILFRDAGPTPKSTKAAEDASDWELPPTSGDPLTGGMPPSSLATGDFGADILGETAPVPGPARTPAAAPAAPGHGTPGDEHADPAAAPRPAVRASLNMRPIAARPLAHKARSGPASALGVLMPPLVFFGGGGTAAWLYLVQQNMVMAGLVAAITLVASAFTRVLFK